MKYRLRFWFWHQEIVIDDIKPEELIVSAFFPNDVDHEQFIRNIQIKDYFYNSKNKTYPIQVTFSEDLNKLVIYHLMEDDMETIDIRFSDGGIAYLDDNFWILEYYEE